jgi:hypothetical protein
MAEIEAPYGAYDFNQLPRLSSAHRTLQARKGISFVENVVRPIKCQLESAFPYPGFQGGVEIMRERANILLLPGEVR